MYCRLVIFCSSFGGIAGAPGSEGRGLGAVGGVGWAVAVTVVTGAVLGGSVRREEGSEMGRVGAADDDIAGKCRADTSGGGGGIPAEVIRPVKRWSAF